MAQPSPAHRGRASAQLGSLEYSAKGGRAFDRKHHLTGCDRISAAACFSADADKVGDLGIRIQDSRFKIQDSRFEIQDSRFKIQDSRFKIQDSRFKIQDSSNYQLQTK